jgi:single-stranded DNA-binding protein
LTARPRPPRVHASRQEQYRNQKGEHITNSQRTPRITLYGNLGAAPESHTLKARTFTQERYDIATDSVVTEERTTDEREIRTASLAVNGRDTDGKEITRWHRLVDHAEHLAGCGKGDRLKVTGFFRNRTYLKDGEERSIRELVVTATEIQTKRALSPDLETALPFESDPLDDNEIPF